MKNPHNTLVRPDRPITLEAHWIHGIADDDVADAPTWPQVVPRLLQATAGRQVLAYNAAYDYQVICADTARCGLDLGPLADADRWGCLMYRRSDWNRTRRWSRLGGGHRALADTRAALEVLQAMTAARTRCRVGTEQEPGVAVTSVDTDDVRNDQACGSDLCRGFVLCPRFTTVLVVAARRVQ